MTIGIVTIPDGQLAGFCEQWRIARLEVFGSVRRPDFRDESDLDFLVTFEDNVPWTLLDMIDMQEQLESITGRKVDLVSRSAIERDPNWIRREEILGSAETVYAA